MTQTRRCKCMTRVAARRQIWAGRKIGCSGNRGRRWGSSRYVVFDPEQADPLLHSTLRLNRKRKAKDSGQDEED